MKVRIVVSYVPRYRHGHRWHFVPPVTGVHLAAMTPTLIRSKSCTSRCDRCLRRRRRSLALSFFSGFARRAYDVADDYRRRGVPVVCGGPHASYWVEEALQHCDAVVVGEAESVWHELLRDAERRCLKPVYRGTPSPLTGLPTPRYDLLESRFIVRRVLQATRGCPFRCSFCSVPDLNPGFRMRPVDDVIRDIAVSRFPHFWQDKVVWFWDDNSLVEPAVGERPIASHGGAESMVADAGIHRYRQGYGAARPDGALRLHRDLPGDRKPRW